MFQRPSGESPVSLPPRSLVDRLALLLATGCGVGLLPRAPGTAGTLLAVPLWLALAQGPGWLQVQGTVALVGLAIWAATRAGRLFGESDDQRIVIDEVAGFWVTMTLVPPTFPNVVVGFVLFRLFDMTKPWPACWFDRQVHSGVGNVMDDVCAGIYGRGGVALFLALTS